MTIETRASGRLRQALTMALGCILAACAVLLGAPPAQAATVTTTEDGITYEADDTNVAAGARITGYDASSPMGLVPVIPSSVLIDGTSYDVKTIGANSFASKALTSVTIPSTVTALHNYAFAQNNLTSVVIPGSVTTLQSGVFEQNNLTSVTIPSSITSIGQGAFSMNDLTSVTLPSTVTNIGPSAFGVNQLTSVTIPATVTNIGSGAFADNPLNSVTFSGNAPTIQPAGSLGSFGHAAGKTLYYSGSASGFTTPTWEGYNTEVATPPTITSGAFHNAGQFQSYTYLMTATGTPAPALSMTGLPSGMTFDPHTGYLYGMPTAVGTYPITLTASNGVAPDAVITQDLLVVTPISFLGSPPPNGTVDSPYSFGMSATGPGTITWSVLPSDPLPPGLAIDPDSGVIHGTPTTAGSYEVRFRASNGGLSPDAFVNHTIVISPAPPANYVVSFDSNGGSTIPDQVVPEGDTVTAPADPTRAGYTFTGWHTDDQLTSLYDFAEPVTGELILYAGWELMNVTPGGPDDSDDGDSSPDADDELSTTGGPGAWALMLPAILALMAGGVLALRGRRRNVA